MAPTYYEIRNIQRQKILFVPTARLEMAYGLISIAPIDIRQWQVKFLEFQAR